MDATARHTFIGKREFAAASGHGASLPWPPYWQDRSRFAARPALTNLAAIDAPDASRAHPCCGIAFPQPAYLSEVEEHANQVWASVTACNLSRLVRDQIKRRTLLHCAQFSHSTPSSEP